MITFIHHKKNLTTQQISASIELMNEIEGAKETVKDASIEPPKEAPKEPKIQKFYKICGLIKNIFLIIIPILSLENLSIYLFYARTRVPASEFFHPLSGYEFILPSWVVELINTQIKILNFLVLIAFLIGSLFIAAGIALYVLYFFNRTDKIKETFGKKFILRGIKVLVIYFVIYFVIMFLYGMFGIDMSGQSSCVIECGI